MKYLLIFSHAWFCNGTDNVNQSGMNQREATTTAFLFSVKYNHKNTIFGTEILGGKSFLWLDRWLDGFIFYLRYAARWCFCCVLSQGLCCWALGVLLRNSVLRSKNIPPYFPRGPGKYWHIPLSLSLCSSLAAFFLPLCLYLRYCLEDSCSSWCGSKLCDLKPCLFVQW